MPPFGYHHQDFGNGHGFFGVFLLIFIVLAVVWALAMFARTRDHRHHMAGSPPPKPVEDSSALRILDERFAKGEIDADEYTTRKDLLRHP
jgi:putative membrane protein